MLHSDVCYDDVGHIPADHVKPLFAGFGLVDLVYSGEISVEQFDDAFPDLDFVFHDDSFRKLYSFVRRLLAFGAVSSESCPSFPNSLILSQVGEYFDSSRTNCLWNENIKTGKNTPLHQLVNYGIFGTAIQTQAYWPRCRRQYGIVGEPGMRFAKRKFLVAALCLLAAAGVTWRIFAMAESTRDTAAVVRVLKRVYKGTRITRDMLHSVEVGAYGLGAEALTGWDGVVGKYAAADLFPEDNLTAEKFEEFENMADSYVQKARDARLSAVSVELGGISAGFSGKLKVGDVVSAFVFVGKSGSDAGKGEVVLDPELKYLEIAAITNNRAEDIEYEADGANDSAGISRVQGDVRVPASITFIVDTVQAIRLIEAENTGKIHIVYQGRGAYGQELLDGEARKPGAGAKEPESEALAAKAKTPAIADRGDDPAAAKPPAVNTVAADMAGQDAAAIARPPAGQGAAAAAVAAADFDLAWPQGTVGK
jgi:pilus assembly protein CpaB